MGLAFFVWVRSRRLDALGQTMIIKKAFFENAFFLPGAFAAGRVRLPLEGAFAAGEVRLLLGRCVCRWGGAFAAGAVRLPLGLMTYNL